MQRIITAWLVHDNQKEVRNEIMVVLFYGVGVLLGYSVYLLEI